MNNHSKVVIRGRFLNSNALVKNHGGARKKTFKASKS